MKLIIAEKPSVARDISKAIGEVETKKIGSYTYCQCGENTLVAYARGHLVRLAEPQEYDEKYAKWNLSDLPIIPQSFKLKPIDDCKQILSALSNLIKSSEVDSLICATDAGREGELIFRLIYAFLGCTKPFERLWISSMTDESIRQGLQNLFPGEAKTPLFKSAITRAKMDFVLGINLSRLYSICYNTNYSVGRVQSATVNMIVQRDNEIKGFVKKPFFNLFLENGADWFDEDITSFAEKKQAEKVKQECEGKLVTVEKADTKRKTENRPLLYSLTSLQIEANEKHGYSAADTLQIAQSLYEKKLLTYPRTDSNYITDDMPDTVAAVVENLKFYSKERVENLQKQGFNFDKRIVDNSKVSDHHALLPTKEVTQTISDELSNEQRNILELVINRLLTVLDEVYTYDETAYLFVCENHTFRLTTKSAVSLGWRKYCPVAINDNEKIFNYKQGETFTAKNLQIKECETKPPKPFTESALLSAMENISRRISDKEKSEFVKERGLGTPATRAGIIERIIKCNYVERSGKKITSTVKGQQMTASIVDEVKNVELTADMEQQLFEIENGKADDKAVLDSTILLVKRVIDREKTVPHENRSDKPKRESVGSCPRCGGAVYEGEKNFYCENFSKKTCIFSVFKDDFFFTKKKKKVTTTIMKALLKDRKAFVKGFYSAEKDKEYNAAVIFKDRKDQKGNDKVGFELEFEK
jgi:DNA topoisomerase-3